MKRNNTGYSWGVVTVVNDGLYTFYLAEPEERRRIIALPSVSGQFLDHFTSNSSCSVNESQITEYDVPKFLTELSKPRWGSLISVPDDVLTDLESHIDLVSQYLRRIVKGSDHNPTIYQVPSLEELKKFDPKRTEMRV